MDNPDWTQCPFFKLKRYDVCFTDECHGVTEECLRKAEQIKQGGSRDRLFNLEKRK